MVFTEKETFANSPKPELVLVTGGTFTMHESDNASTDSKLDERINVKTFSIGRYEVTWGQFKAFSAATGYPMPPAPKWGIKDNHPVINVNYDDCLAYCTWLSETYGGTWRLPTEAEWEFAARGGNKSYGFTCSGSNDIDEVGWYSENTYGTTMGVGLMEPNELGIHDMSGNVWEWCSDWRSEYSKGSGSSPEIQSTGSRRVIRGGSWDYGDAFSEITNTGNRGSSNPSRRDDSNGFRVVLEQ